MPERSARARRYRARQAQGVAVYRVEADHDLLYALLDSGRITDDQALSRPHVERAVADVLAEWSRRWREKKP